jgi:hypothetical protein
MRTVLFWCLTILVALSAVILAIAIATLGTITDWLTESRDSNRL